MTCKTEGLYLSLADALRPLGGSAGDWLNVKKYLFDGAYDGQRSLRTKLIRFTQTHPMLLLPLRLETRFKDSQLRIRIYPDQIAINAHDPTLSEEESTTGIEYQETLAQADFTADPEETKRAAWRGLAARYGPERAAWIAKVTKNVTGPPELKLTDPNWLTVPTVMSLPVAFAAFLYRFDENGEERLWRGPILGKPVRRSLPLIGTPTATQKELFDTNSRWVVDYDRAVEEGMAISVDISDLSAEELEKGVSKIIVVGIRSSNADGGQCLLEQLIDNHHYSDGFGFLKYGTPTNNTQQTQSGHSRTREDREKSYEVEVAGPPGWNAAGSYAQEFAHMVGLGASPVSLQSLRHLEHAGNTEDDYADDMNQALWPATGDYILRELLPGVADGERTRLENHVRRFVRGSGPIPGIRASDQPYGVLPVTSVRRHADDNPHGWVAAFGDNANDEAMRDFEDGLQRIVSRLFEIWLRWAHDERRVPRVNTGDNPDQELLQILSMAPLSQDYRMRPVIDERFTGWMLSATRSHAFSGPGFASSGRSSNYWVGRWGDTWNSQRWQEAEFWHQISGVDPSQFVNSPLLRTLGWGRSRRLAIPLVVGAAGVDQDLPENYLQTLWDSGTCDADTLLCDLLTRSLILCQSAQGAQCDSIRDAIADLAAAAQEKKTDLDRLIRQSLDQVTHRLDSWATAHATKRLDAMRAENLGGLYLGAYGWVENLKPRDVGADSKGYIHAPSRGQAAAGAVLYNAHLTHDYDTGQPHPFSINLNSERVRRGLRLLEGIRQGQPVGALLGYQFERALHEVHLDRFIDDFRQAFPLIATKETETDAAESVEATAARNVVDGLQLVRWWQDPTSYNGTSNPADINVIKDYLDQTGEPYTTLLAEVKRLIDARDCISDLLTYEGVFQTVQGNYERAGSALEAVSGNGYPPEIESVTTPVQGKMLAHRVCVLFPPEPSPVPTAPNPVSDPRREMEPRIAEWYANLLGGLSQIGCGYQFHSLRLNVNEATREALASLPGVSEADAQAIVDYRDQFAPFATLDDLQNVPQLAAAVVETLLRWARTGTEQTAAERYYDRINLNTADAPELMLLPGIDVYEAHAIITQRAASPIHRIGELVDILAGTTIDLELIRPFVTTDVDELSVTELELNPNDLLYLSATLPQGEETEIEQRIRYWVRREYALSYDTDVEIDLSGSAAFDYGLSAALELGRQVLGMLDAGKVLRPGSLRFPGEADTTLFTSDDVNRFRDRGNTAHTSRSNVRDALAALIDEPNEMLTDRAAAVDALFEAARFGVSAAIPLGTDDPLLYTRAKNVHDELTKGAAAYEKLRDDVIGDTARNDDRKIEGLFEAVKSLFGGNFVALPTFSLPGVADPDRAEWAAEFDKAFVQINLLAGLGDERVRLWLRQAAQVHPALQDLEDGIMMVEAWEQSSFTMDAPALQLEVAQLPYDPAKYWFALDDDERGFGINDNDEEGRGYLSIVAAVAKGQSLLPFGGEAPNAAAGLLIDQWDELIPNDIVDTSVAFQYNAPNTQAPQSLLLAVPSQRDNPKQEWSLQELAAIVRDTLDLAKVRTVDLDAMQDLADGSGDERGVGQVFPAVILPIERQEWQWKRNYTVVMQAVGDWEHVLQD